ncbi:very short patch repair endonuclease [Cellulomonas dongxiuzhuiae]|uniref:very short patch repair endonuclease n=1 Tax=Cellulomonas dongxiuzhuiae TaxID=2819979 RepID=UPI0027DC98FB|nr:very short patch repair endonuclease [Cellulomonas dongxiuzhuiae]
MPNEPAAGVDAEPPRRRPAPEVSARYSSLARTGTAPEMLLRRELHRRGRRFRVHARIEGLPRRRVDIAFTRWRVCVLVDGCFWHSCPEHGVLPQANRDWWEWKLERTRQRDADTDAVLRSLGWTVVRVWEHVSAVEAADTVEFALTRSAATVREDQET